MVHWSWHFSPNCLTLNHPKNTRMSQNGIWPKNKEKIRKIWNCHTEVSARIFIQTITKLFVVFSIRIKRTKTCFNIKSSCIDDCVKFYWLLVQSWSLGQYPCYELFGSKTNHGLVSVEVRSCFLRGPNTCVLRFWCNWHYRQLFLLFSLNAILADFRNRISD